MILNGHSCHYSINGVVKRVWPQPLWISTMCWFLVFLSFSHMVISIVFLVHSHTIWNLQFYCVNFIQTLWLGYLHRGYFKRYILNKAVYRDHSFELSINNNTDSNVNKWKTPLLTDIYGIRCEELCRPRSCRYRLWVLRDFFG